MPLFTLLILLVLLGVLAWATRRYMPETTQPMKTIILVVLGAVAVLLVLQAFGILTAIGGIMTPRV
jgi:endonuclease/exonuclease/phosphatase (EEP) superfamily protein YafD